MSSMGARGFLQKDVNASCSSDVARSQDPHGDIIFLFATVSALQHIGDDRRSRGRILSVPVHRLEPPVPLTSRRPEELEEPRHVVLSLVCDTVEQLASAVPELLGIVDFAFAMKGFCLDLSCGKTEGIFVPRVLGKPRAMATVAHDDDTFESSDRRSRKGQDYVHMERQL